MLLDIGGIVINLENLVSFKVKTERDRYILQLFMLDGTGYNVSYENIDHFLGDVKAIQEATKIKK